MPGMFIIGFFSGLLTAFGVRSAWDIDGQSGPMTGPVPPPLPPPDMSTVSDVTSSFHPYVKQAIEIVKARDPGIVSSAQKLTAYLPGLVEANAMYYAMVDDKTPITPKLEMAGALIYFISPVDLVPDNVPVVGYLDDIGVLMKAFEDNAEHITPEHMARAKAWLKAQGIDPKPFVDLADLGVKMPGTGNQPELPLRNR